MEIQTNNLLSISFDGNRLSTNFMVIDELIKKMQSHLTQITKKQDAFQQCIDHQNKSIYEIQKKHQEQSKTISVHSDVLEQLGMDLQSEQEGAQKNQHHSKSQITIAKRVSLRSEEQIKHDQNNSSNVKPQQSKVKPSKFGIDKVMSNVKQRLAFLEQDSDEKKHTIHEIQAFLEKNKFQKGNGSFQKKSIPVTRKGSSSKKNLFDEKRRPSHIVPELQLMQQFSSSSIPRSTQEVKEQQLNIELDFTGKEEIGKEVLHLRDCLVQKIRAIQAQFRQNNQKTKSIQKSIDLLQRSHQMLKYDFDRTSTSWTKNRSANTQDRNKKDQRFSEIRLNTPQQYEEKIGQIFTQMNVIKKDYMEIQNKLLLNKQQEGSCSFNSLQVPQEGKDKNRLVHTLKTEGSEQKKDINMIKRQLTKLRSQFQDFAFGINTGPSETKTVVIKPNENKQDWKILSSKMYKLKMEVQAGLRDMQNKIAANNDMVVVLNSLETAIQECRLLMKRKVQTTDFEKGIKRVETKLNSFIMQIYDKQSKENQAQATLAKQPWFCLSCGDQLKNYTAKLTKSPPKQKLTGKKVNPESHMVRRNENGRFPSVIK